MLLQSKELRFSCAKPWDDVQRVNGAWYDVSSGILMCVRCFKRKTSKMADEELLSIASTVSTCGLPTFHQWKVAKVTKLTGSDFVTSLLVSERVYSIVTILYLLWIDLWLSCVVLTRSFNRHWTETLQLSTIVVVFETARVRQWF